MPSPYANAESHSKHPSPQLRNAGAMPSGIGNEENTTLCNSLRLCAFALKATFTRIRSISTGRCPPFSLRSSASLRPCVKADDARACLCAPCERPDRDSQSWRSVHTGCGTSSSAFPKNRSALRAEESVRSTPLSPSQSGIRGQ